MTVTKIAIISDMHCGQHCRGGDLCPPNSPTGTPSAKKPDPIFAATFLKFLEEHPISADFLILPGDISHTAHPEEVSLASIFVTQAAEKLGITDQIAFVPGNHDVDWTVLQGSDTTGMRKQQRYDSLRFNRFQFKSILERAAGDLLAPPHFAIWNRPRLLVAGYNSSHDDDPKIALHHGKIDVHDMERFDVAMQAIPFQNDQFRVFLVHHHSHMYPDPGGGADFSAMQNAEVMMGVLAKHRFDMIIHGHQHVPRFTTLGRDGHPPIGILSAGSFSLELPTSYSGVVSNQFHLLTFEGRDPADNVAKGTIESWAYTTPRHWQPSDEHSNGIAHREPFGSYLSPERLEALIESLVVDSIENSGYVEWTTLCEKNELLKHLRPSVIVTTLERVLPRIQCRKHGANPPGIVILKGHTNVEQ